MKKVGGPISYIKYNELDLDKPIFEKAKYVESFEGKYGINHKFTTEDMAQVVLPSAGQLNYLISTYLTEGMDCQVVYKGKVELTKGAMKGKEAHNFDLLVEDSKPLTKVAANTSLDDLE